MGLGRGLALTGPSNVPRDQQHLDCRQNRRPKFKAEHKLMYGPHDDLACLASSCAEISKRGGNFPHSWALHTKVGSGGENGGNIHIQKGNLNFFHEYEIT